MKNVLLYLGKFPGYGFDIDGGSILARQLIDCLKYRCHLDVVFIRKKGETFCDPAVRSIRYEEYKDAFNNKFIRRLENLDTNRAAIGNYDNYDRIVTAHTSKFFGFLPNEISFWNKTVLFPMFCTPSYQRAGEIVPQEYTYEERIVLNNVRKIITPSITEKNELTTVYGCEESRINIIARGVNPVFHPKKDTLSSPPYRIVYIASIKPQKNNLEAILLLQKLLDTGIKYELHMVCTIQDDALFQDIKDYIEFHKLSQNVFFHIGIHQEELASLLQSMDINISVSNWETFGRGIYEGMASGLPTFVMKHLNDVRYFCGDIPGICFTDNIDSMSKEILYLTQNQDEYSSRQFSLLKIAPKLSYKVEGEKLASAILDD